MKCRHDYTYFIDEASGRVTASCDHCGKRIRFAVRDEPPVGTLDMMTAKQIRRAMSQ